MGVSVRGLQLDRFSRALQNPLAQSLRAAPWPPADALAVAPKCIRPASTKPPGSGGSSRVCDRARSAVFQEQGEPDRFRRFQGSWRKCNTPCWRPSPALPRLNPPRGRCELALVIQGPGAPNRRWPRARVARRRQRAVEPNASRRCRHRNAKAPTNGVGFQTGLARVRDAQPFPWS